MLGAVQCCRLVRTAAEAIRSGRAPPQCLQAQIGAVSVGPTRLGGRAAGGEMTGGAVLTNRVAHWCTWRRPNGALIT